VDNTHVIDGDVVAEITRLKQAPGKNIVQYGFGVVSRLLLEHGLLLSYQTGKTLSPAAEVIGSHSEPAAP
jgi:hypothetical protein